MLAVAVWATVPARLAFQGGSAAVPHSVLLSHQVNRVLRKKSNNSDLPEVIHGINPVYSGACKPLAAYRHRNPNAAKRVRAIRSGVHFDHDTPAHLSLEDVLAQAGQIRQGRRLYHCL